MVPFSGRVAFRQYVPNKPDPVGIKLFVLATASGKVIGFHAYHGQTTYASEAEENMGVGIGGQAVLRLTKNLAPGHVLYFDRYFTTLSLLKVLLERGFGCTGTLMMNRVPGALKTKLPTDKKLNEKGRGTHVQVVSSDKPICFVKWTDNKAVHMVSTVDSASPSDTCQRWSKDNKHTEVSRPAIIARYNTNMGGVDLSDRLLSYFPLRSRTSKWTVRVTFHMVDLALTNSWFQYLEEKCTTERHPTIF
ncbi:piggyBac transposable element-derived protein 3-like [Ornithodoros turicata]|uniref:piggyBac transposable element-derived protein 3-like n=1 Tax=Ornithodoros turicata TaxID=34597 RepID=UPI003139A36A